MECFRQHSVIYTRGHFKFRDFYNNLVFNKKGEAMSLFLEILLLVVGMVLLIKGADFFVDGSSNIAKAMRIPTVIIGLTLVSMGTSAPELAVSISAAIKGSNDISLGNVVGSNTFNTFLILGISAVLIPLIVDDGMKKI